MKRLGYIGIGSNLGDRLAALRCVLRYLNLHEGMEVLDCSRVAQTSPLGFDSENEFLNAVVEVRCALEDSQLDGLLRDCEIACGRQPAEAGAEQQYADRHIDVDLLWLDGWDGRDSKLQVPHPRAQERAFVILPLAQLAPALKLGSRTVSQWAAELPEGQVSDLQWRDDLQLWPFGQSG